MHVSLDTSEENGLTPKNPIFGMKRKHWTENQAEILMKTFKASAYGYPERKELDQLAESLNVSKKRVENWFSHMRFRLAKRGMLPQSE